MNRKPSRTSIKMFNIVGDSSFDTMFSLKMYSENPEKMTVWTQSDADAYLNAIKTTLKDFWKQEK